MFPTPPFLCEKSEPFIKGGEGGGERGESNYEVGAQFM